MNSTCNVPAQKWREVLRWLLASMVATTVAPSSAWAYCRTTTCDSPDAVDDPNCLRDEDGCSTTGIPLEWRQACVSFSVEAEGSPLRGISYNEAIDTISRAMAIWVEADCEPGRPSIEMVAFDAYECGEIGYSDTGANSNAWVFRDDGWEVDGSHPPDALALTTVSYNPVTGEILDVDIEVNSEFFTLTESDNSAFAGIALHEAGHVFGLADLRTREDVDSAMFFNYQSSLGSTVELGMDDAAGICAIYPADTTTVDECDPAPRRGFSPACPSEQESTLGSCGCSLPQSPVVPEGLAWPGVLLLAWLRRRALGDRAASAGGAPSRPTGPRATP